ncbi:glycoside hydrolase family 65 [Fontivita pretiosa]|uniref:glycoside hydrolase family 65 n=1 Tax=Fontivita pretiosa TaxID=2989684 RepID=UPI003D1654A4
MVAQPESEPIDRRAVVLRHNVTLRGFDPLSPLSVGNGEFAFTADLTGLQTFPQLYEKFTPLCTMAQWGWHTIPMPAELRGQQIRYAEYDTYGRKVPYLTARQGQEPLYNWLRENPHKLHLGRISLELIRPDGSRAVPEDIRHAEQTLDLWTGVLTSRFEFDGAPVTVQTCCAGELDAVAVKIESPLIAKGRLSVWIRFPYGSPDRTAADWTKPEAHETQVLRAGENRAKISRRLDGTDYHASLIWSKNVALAEPARHELALNGSGASGSAMALVCAFAQQPIAGELPSPDEAFELSRRFWLDFWTSGGAIDLSGSTDPRARELERRIVLSQYLTRVNCAGSLPPQETGLVCNSWYGKFHLEMHWWHGVHFAAWGRIQLLERSLGFYQRILPVARENARRQGYRGARWTKMVGPDGIDSPSPIGPLLIWQQPHPIYYAELCYRQNPTRQTLEQWKAIVEESADFMASYAVRDPTSGLYVLGPPIKIVSEHNETSTTRNPTFELSYWRFGLRIAQQWRHRLGLAANPQWQEVLDNLSPLPHKDGLYLSYEGDETYTTGNWEHPALIGALGMLPGDGVGVASMRRTLEKVMQVWQWDRCWGWDFPMTAMCAARVGRPDLAVDALLIDSVKNRYLPNGHVYQRENLTLYLPGNGGLLSAVAMMAAGWDGAPEGADAPGFPRQGWKVKWEGLRRWM